MPKSSRRWWWIGGVLLLVVALGFFLWPRSIRIPLKDGTTLTISAITVGTEHLRPEPISWGALKAQVAQRKWGWPARGVQMPEPCVIFWFDGMKPPDDWRCMTLTDRHGWRWVPSSAMGDQSSYRAAFQPVETDGTVRFEMHGKDGLLGAAVIPLASAVPVATPAAIPTVPPIPVKPGEPAPLPIRRTEGPLEATLRSFDVQTSGQDRSWSRGRLQLGTLWNGRPIVPEIAFMTITDRFGRREMLFPQAEQPLEEQPLGDQSFTVQFLPPHEAVWDLHFKIFRSLETPLDPEETVVVTPKLAEGETVFQQEGSNQGRKWRLTLVPPGTPAPAGLFAPWKFPFQESVPLIVAEVDPQHPLRVRIEALDREGNNFPAIAIVNIPLPPNVYVARSPEFDAAQGHTIRVGFDEARLVQFTVRPDVVVTEAAK